MNQQEDLHLANPAQPDVVSNTLSVGQWLVQARQAKGLSVHEVASRSNRAVRQLESLEADNFGSFNSPSLLRAVIRHYAKVVEVNPEEALRLLPVQFQSTAEPKPVRVSEKIPMKGAPMKTPWIAKTWLVLLALVVIGLLAYWVLFSRFLHKTDGAQKVTEANQVQVIAPTNPSAKVATAAPSVDTPVVTSSPVVSAPSLATASSSTLTSTSTALTNGGVAASDGFNLKFNAASWVEIKDAKGSVLLSGIQAAGTEQKVSGELPLKVKIGNASQVEVTWKGLPYDLKPWIANKGRDVAKIDTLN